METQEPIEQERRNVDPGGSISGRRYFRWDLAGRQTGFSNTPFTPEGDGDNTITYDARGLVSSVSGTSGTTTIVRDDAGRPIRRTDATGTHDWTWTPRSELRTATDPLTGLTTTNTYDEQGRLVRTEAADPDDPDGESVVTIREYVENDRIGEVVVTPSNDSGSHSQVWRYDDDGLVTNHTFFVDGLLSDSEGFHRYTYDGAGRLTQSTSPARGPRDYTYDGAGNRLTEGDRTFAYDARNRLTRAGDETYEWSPRGTLVATTDSTTGTERAPMSGPAVMQVSVGGGA